MIGVSIAIPPPYGDELQRWRASFGDPLAGSIPTHVTLLPPTEVPLEDLEEFRAHLESVAKAAAPFRMTLRGTGTFRPVSPVVFVQVAGGLAECEQLEGAIRGGPLHRDLAFNYHPHVTVAHHVDEASMDRAFEDLAGYTCTFEVTEFHLYEHGTDRVWRAVHAFAFEAGPDHEDTLRR
jgi:2'-5' RNA ligase